MSAFIALVIALGIGGFVGWGSMSVQFGMAAFIFCFWVVRILLEMKDNLEKANRKLDDRH